MATHAALTAVMRQSATEFRALLTKAGRGVGLSPGLSEDLARTSVWLQACGFAGGEAALDAIEGLASEDSDPGFISLSNPAISSSGSGGNLSSAYIGAQLADAVKLGWPSALGCVETALVTNSGVYIQPLMSKLRPILPRFNPVEHSMMYRGIVGLSRRSTCRNVIRR